MTTLSMTPLTIPQLETVYDTLAQAIDQVEPRHTELFLTKLCLLLANQMGDDAAFAKMVQAALLDL